MSRGEIECLADSGTAHTILWNKQLFTDFVHYKSSVTTMIGSSPVIQERGIAQFLLPNGTKIHVTDALYALKANRALLSFKDIRSNGFHLETHRENDKEFLCITSNECGRKRTLEKLMSQSSDLYLTTIQIIESYAVARNFYKSNSYKLWHDLLGHPRRDIMIRILKNSHGHPFFRAQRRM